MIRRLAAAIEADWYRRGPRPWLIPPALVFAAVVAVRRRLYRYSLLPRYQAARPVLVVGNITVGGTGKTPLLIALVALAQARGIAVGVVSRGYGGAGGRQPRVVDLQTPPADCGDEPALIARRCRVPLVVAADRHAAATRLCTQAPDTELIITDDGLQHYRLMRDAEIAVRDARRGYGNGWLLPAGPLREPVSRTRGVDLEAVQGPAADFSLEVTQAVRLVDGERRALVDFIDRPVHGVAGIGDPQRFFEALRDAGLTVRPHPRPDHHVYEATELCFDEDLEILMTEKDAVKCEHFDNPRLWRVPAEAVLAADFAARVDALLDVLIPRTQGAVHD